MRISWKKKRAVNPVAYKVVTDGRYGECVTAASYGKSGAGFHAQQACLLTTGSALRLVLQEHTYYTGILNGLDLCQSS
jgi:N-formylglutamate amidohydrolase